MPRIGVKVVRVLILGYSHLKYDKRVFRTVQALSKNAEVIYQFLSISEEHPYEDGNVNYVPLFKRSAKSFLDKVVKRVNFDKAIEKLVTETDFDVLYLHDFPITAPLAVFKAGRKKARKVVFDMHELYPGERYERLPSPLRFIKRELMWRILHEQVSLSDNLIFVSEEQRDEVLKRISLPRKVMVIPNYASLSYQNTAKNREICIVGRTSRQLTANEIRILRALSDLGFTIKQIGAVTNLPSDLNHMNLPLLPYDEMMREISKAAFTWISYYSDLVNLCPNDALSLPNKFFDSIGAGTPVIVKDSFVSMKRFVERYGIGVVINPDHVQESVEKISRAYEEYALLVANILRHQQEFVWDSKKEEQFVQFVLG